MPIQFSCETTYASLYSTTHLLTCAQQEMQVSVLKMLQEPNSICRSSF